MNNSANCAVEHHKTQDEELSATLGRLSLQRPTEQTQELNTSTQTTTDDLTVSKFNFTNIRQAVSEEMEQASFSMLNSRLGLANVTSATQIQKLSKVVSKTAKLRIGTSRASPRTVLDRLVDWLARMLQALDQLVFSKVAKKRVTNGR